MLLRRYLFIPLIFIPLLLSGQEDKRLQDENDSLVYQVYYYEGGAKSSEGYLRDGKPDGYWKSYYRNGKLKAEGNRDNYLLDGPWAFYSEEGKKILEINYSEDKKNGLRKTIDNGTVVKEENFVNDRLQGFTREYFDGGQLKREIPFVDGQENGIGYEYSQEDGRIISLLTYKNGVLTKKQQINRLDEQLQKQGLWVDFYPNRNSKVEGPYINNLKNGYWKYYRANGDLMRVEKWVMGELQENAQEVAKVEIKQTLDPNTGKLAFKGAYRNGKPEGVHRQYDSEGNVIASKIYEGGIVLFEGIVDENGRKQGPWKEFYPTGELKAEGSYKDDLKIGNWVYYYIDGDIEQSGTYLRGLPDGIWTWYYENGQTWREEEYLAGREDGPSVEYSDSGVVIAKGNYIDGKKDGEWLLEINDHRETGNYFDGLRNGKWVHHYLDNGQLRFEGTFENGLENGMHTYYYPNGRVERRGRYIGGERDGIWEFFTESGQLIINIEYENGSEVKYNGERIRYSRKLDKELEEQKSSGENPQP